MTTASGHTTAIRASRVIGTPVKDGAGETIGKVEDVILEKTDNNIMFAVVGFGGVLGVGEKYHPLPWQVLNYDKGKDGYVVSLTKEQLKRAPYYARDELSDNDLAWRQKVFDYYETPPYWV